MGFSGEARIARVVRYPVKGFGGEPIDAAELEQGRGLPFDRWLGVANGSSAVREDPGWVRSRAFCRLFANSELPHYRASFDGSTVAFTSLRDGCRVETRLDDPTGRKTLDAALASWFPAGRVGTAHLVTSAGNLWDWEDAEVSLINLATLNELAGAAGATVDPRRFRGNLYLEGIPAWEEFALVGRRIRIGGAELEVLRPIDRCRATVVDPDTADTSLNLPAELVRHFGSIHCGVYARVVSGGRVGVGDAITDLAAAPSAVRDGAAVEGAEPEQWPRWAVLDEVITESETVRSLWLHDPLTAYRPAPLPGQYLRLRTADSQGPVWRNYTISGVEGDRLRISVKHDGRFSRLLHDAVPGTRFLLSGPFGEMTLDESEAPVLLYGGGIGITPIVAMLRRLAAERTTRTIRIVQCARHARDLALWDEVLALVAGLPDAQALLYLSEPLPGDLDRLDAVGGRPGAAALAAPAKGLHDPVAYLCGPTPFMLAARAVLQDSGVTDIRQEVFLSPRATAGECRPPPSPGPFTVRFAISDTRAIWKDTDGTLLDVAEREGLSLPYNCRTGACNTCRQPLLTGRTAYLTDPVIPPDPPMILLCCAVPTSDLEISDERAD